MTSVYALETVGNIEKIKKLYQRENYVQHIIIYKLCVLYELKKKKKKGMRESGWHAPGWPSGEAGFERI